VVLPENLPAFQRSSHNFPQNDIPKAEIKKLNEFLNHGVHEKEIEKLRNLLKGDLSSSYRNHFRQIFNQKNQLSVERIIEDNLWFIIGRLNS